MKENDVGVHGWLKRAEEKVAYLIVFAPDFPAEDETDLDREFGRLSEYMGHLQEQVAEESGSEWIRLARIEAADAAGSFRAGDEERGSQLLQQVEERLKSFRRGQRSRTTFVAGPDGTLTRHDDDDGGGAQ